jgi:hypothetical protein
MLAFSTISSCPVQIPEPWWWGTMKATEIDKRYNSYGWMDASVSTGKNPGEWSGQFYMGIGNKWSKWSRILGSLWERVEDAHREEGCLGRCWLWTLDEPMCFHQPRPAVNAKNILGELIWKLKKLLLLPEDQGKQIQGDNFLIPLHQSSPGWQFI